MGERQGSNGSVLHLSNSTSAEHPLGSVAIAWLGEGHVQGTVVASIDEERLLCFHTAHAPQWFALDELQAAQDVDHEEDALQCTGCLYRRPGQFSVHGFWICHTCVAASA